MKLAEFIKQNPKQVGAFADRLGVCRQTVHRWATGRRTPRPTQMRAIIEATEGQVTPNDFLADSKKKEPA